MIQKFRLGEPIATDAVVMELPICEGEIPYFKKEGTVLSRKLEAGDQVYGLGENLHGINKRGGIYVSNNTDDPNHTESKTSLYGSHNFLVINGTNPVGLFIDDPGNITFDVGFTHLDQLVITLKEENADLYIITAEDDESSCAQNSIIRQFRQMIGRSYIPPRWAFGFGQSRWSYPTEEAVREVVRRHRENHLPLDMVYLDIDYMERFKDFTVNKEAFPDLEGLTKEMLAQGIHLVPIIDAGVKVEEGYPVDEEGLEKGYFCKMEDGSVFEGAVWPGLAHFPDVLNPEARRWFGLQYKFLLDMGIDGFWNDMNEPALFFTPGGLERFWNRIEKFRGRTNMDVYELWGITGAVDSLANSSEDYQSFYHEVDGKKIRHDRVHNLYGYNMTRAASEGFDELCPEKRILMFSRSSYVGMHRYGGIWTGDNHAWWSHLLLNIKMMPSLNMCGFLYSGADLGGFNSNTTEDLMLRWLEFGVFTPLMRNHSALGTRLKECYQFDRTQDFANILGIRYGLMPYIYSEYMKAALDGGMYFSTMTMMYPEDSFAPQVEDQLFVGESLMIAPVHEQNAEGRYVYLPEQMKLLRMRSISDYDEEILPAGHHYVKAALNEILVFIRPNRLVPVTKPAETSAEMDFEHVTLLGYVLDEAVYEYYCDDGVSKDYENPANRRVFRVQA
ncbi:MAG: alpha-glucosidase [Lachnospiraceae bacterium]|nr:alpha-glucosidase [Lachnospiraceae bacterium]